MQIYKGAISLNIAIVGAGHGGYNIINSLSKLEDVHISIVVDINANAPGLALAKNLKIMCSQSLDDIQSNSIDVIIEATGNNHFAEILYTKFGDKCKIIDSQGALLIMSLVKQDMKTLQKLSNQMDVIHKTSSIVQNQLNSISVSIETIHDISDKLLSSTKNSSEHIDQSDKIIHYVNSIAKQTKILGINATIEAARAGEHGKGFSIVANEVQKLANSSENFAKEINSILLQLSNEIKIVNNEVSRLDTLSNTQLQASEEVNSAITKLISETSK